MIRMMSAALAAAGLAAAAAHQPKQAPASPASNDAGVQQDFRWSGRIADGEEIMIKNIVGEIRAEPASGGEVTVTAVRRGGWSDRVRVEMVRRGGSVVVCAVYPPSSRDGDGRRWNDDDDDDDGGRNGHEPRDACNQRHTSVHNDDGAVDFVVRVPAGVRLAAYSVSGDVEVRGLRGPVDARSVSGDVHVASTGEVEANSVSGNVVASLGRMGGHDLSFRSVSGNVTLEVPAGLDAEFHAHTLSGDIESDFPLRSTRGRGRDRDEDDDDDGGRGFRVRVRIGQDARGTLGRGGPSLNVTTVSGDVALRRSR